MTSHLQGLFTKHISSIYPRLTWPIWHRCRYLSEPTICNTASKTTAGVFTVLLSFFLSLHVALVTAAPTKVIEGVPKTQPSNTLNVLLPVTCDLKITSRFTDGQCYKLAVPRHNLDQNQGSTHKKSTPETINLNILRLPSLSHGQSVPLFVIAGGPGQSAVKIAPQVAVGLSSLRKEHDLIFVDQRGTGQSEPLNCEDPTPQLNQTSADQTQRQIDTLRHCLNGFNNDLSTYTTRHAVNDLEAVRHALDYTKINLWGASYGTRVALQYMSSYPSKVNTSVLDGPAPYDIALPTHIAQDTHNALSTIFSHCEQQPSCKEAFPNLRSNWKETLVNLKTHPQEITFSHPRSEIQENVYLDPYIISSWLRMSLYVRDLAPLIPLAIHRANQGDFANLYSFSKLTENMVGDLSHGMHMAVLCSEDFQITQQRQKSLSLDTTLQDPLIYLSEAEVLDKVCDLVPVSDIPDNNFELTEHAIPSLVITGNLDPITPEIWAEAIMPKLKNGVHLDIAGGHHGVSFLGCMPRIISQFISTGNLTEAQTACIANIKPKAFFIDKAGPALGIERQADDHASNIEGAHHD